nr:MAG TPA: hypothetical protein [Caudoviricetes sp.]
MKPLCINGFTAFSFWQREKDLNPHKQSQSLCLGALKPLCANGLRNFLEFVTR